jgi:hypothetical protein
MSKQSGGFSLRYNAQTGEWDVVELGMPHRDSLSVYQQQALMQVIDLGLAQCTKFPEIEELCKKVVDS